MTKAKKMTTKTDPVTVTLTPVTLTEGETVSIPRSKLKVDWSKNPRGSTPDPELMDVLRTSIKKFDFLGEVTCDKNGELIIGYHRVAVLDELRDGKDYDIRVFVAPRFSSAADALAFRLNSDFARRDYDTFHYCKSLAELRAMFPEKTSTDEFIAMAGLGVSKSHANLAIRAWAKSTELFKRAWMKNPAPFTFPVIAAQISRTPDKQDEYAKSYLLISEGGSVPDDESARQPTPPPPSIRGMSKKEILAAWESLNSRKDLNGREAVVLDTLGWVLGKAESLPK